MKVASEKHAREALAEMVSKGKFDKRELMSRIKSFKGAGTDELDKVYNKALQSLNKGKIDKNVYDAFNSTLIYDKDNPGHNIGTKKFYDYLTSKGYDAIMDVNDKKYSGYGTTSPMIAFNAAGKAAVNKVREVGIDELDKSYSIGVGRAYSKQLLKKYGPWAVGLGAMGVVGNAANKAKGKRERDKIVIEYRKQHPSSRLSYNDIVDSYYNK